MFDFDLTIKNIDPYTVRNIPVLIDLLMRRERFMEEDYAEALGNILECCSDNLSEPEPDEPSNRIAYRNALSEIFHDCVLRMLAAQKECFQSEE